MGFFSTIKSVSKIAAACGLVATSNACLVVGRETGIAARKVAGDSWDKVPGSATNEKLVRELSPAVEKALAEYIAKVGEKKAEEKAAPTPQATSAQTKGTSRGENHSPYAVLKKDGYWEDSPKAKQEGKSMPALYKGANKARYALIGGKGWDFVPNYPDGDGNFHSLAWWTGHAVRNHAEWREGEGDQNVWTSKVLNSYVQMVWTKAFEPEERKGFKLPTFEELIELSGGKAAKKQEAAPATPAAPKAAPAQEQEEIVSDDGLPRDGGAPKREDLVVESPEVLAEELKEELEMIAGMPDAAPAPARTFTALTKALHLGRITEGNALTKAKAVAAAYEAGTINAAELDSLRKAIEKKFKGDQEQLEAAFAA